MRNFLCAASMAAFIMLPGFAAAQAPLQEWLTTAPPDALDAVAVFAGLACRGAVQIVAARTGMCVEITQRRVFF